MENLNRKGRLKAVEALLPAALQHPLAMQSLQMCLLEDLTTIVDFNTIFPEFVQGDVTSVATLKLDASLSGEIRAKAQGVVAGLDVATAIFALVEPKIEFASHCADGDRVVAGTLLAEVSGPGAALLTAERAALNYLGRMSGIATLTRQYVDRVVGSNAVILDTRKTAPGLRLFDKYAVCMGGGQNHRMGLYDMVLIKDNHIDGAGSITAAIARTRARFGDQYPIEVEVKNLAELDESLKLTPDRIMLDNMPLETMRQAVTMAAGRVPLEASGNVSLETVRAIAETGVDFISVGALTHSAPALDVSMRIG
jgi:nicotinate-nucleotide pyrophosphorylase (carboxylating)